MAQKGIYCQPIFPKSRNIGDAATSNLSLTIFGLTLFNQLQGKAAAIDLRNLKGGIRNIQVDGQHFFKHAPPGITPCDTVSPGIIEVGRMTDSDHHCFQGRRQHFIHPGRIFFKGTVNGFQGRQVDQLDGVAPRRAEDFRESRQVGGDEPAAGRQSFEKDQGQALEKRGQDLDMGQFHQFRKTMVVYIAMYSDLFVQFPGKVHAHFILRPLAAAGHVQVPIPILKLS